MHAFISQEYQDIGCQILRMLCAVVIVGVCSDLEIFTCGLGLGLVLGLGVWPRLTSLALTVGTLTRAKLRQIITIITTMTDDDYFFIISFYCALPVARQCQSSNGKGC